MQYVHLFLTYLQKITYLQEFSLGKFPPTKFIWDHKNMEEYTLEIKGNQMGERLNNHEISH